MRNKNTAKMSQQENTRVTNDPVQLKMIGVKTVGAKKHRFASKRHFPEFRKKLISKKKI